VLQGDPSKVPAAYRDMIARYHRWLAERAGAPTR